MGGAAAGRRFLPETKWQPPDFEPRGENRHRSRAFARWHYESHPEWLGCGGKIRVYPYNPGYPSYSARSAWSRSRPRTSRDRAESLSPPRDFAEKTRCPAQNPRRQVPSPLHPMRQDRRVEERSRARARFEKTPAPHLHHVQPALTLGLTPCAEPMQSRSIQESTDSL